jgi:uncharacterized protein (TIGR02231 family)
MRLPTAVLLAAVAVASHASDISATLPIDKVTVYRGSAIVTRAGLVEFPAGEHRLIVRGLPDGVDPATLRLSAKSGALRLGAIETERIFETELVGAAERAINRRLRDLADQKAAIEDDIVSAQSQLKLLDAVAKDPVGGSLPVSLDYQMDDVGWSWQYEARLDSQEKKVALVRQAQLSQGTGEDWKNIELRISTSRPGVNATTPALASAFLDFHPPRGYTPGQIDALEEVVVTGARHSVRREAAMSIRAADIGAVQNSPSSVTAMATVDAEVYASDFVADYRIPGRVSVTADRQPRVYPIGNDELDVDLVARANLAADRAAYLEAKLSYKGDLPIDAGDVQLYRDDAFVGVGELPLVLPGADVRIPFGQDDRIRVVVRDEREESGKTGVIAKDQIEQHKRRFEITSFHARAFPLEIIDRLPVSREDDIRIEVLKGATPPTTRDLDGHAGVLLWRLAGEPRKTETIRHYYSVRFPRSRELRQTVGT